MGNLLVKYGVTGFTAGAASGFVGGFGGGLAAGQNFGDALISGLTGAAIGGAVGGTMGVIGGGIKQLKVRKAEKEWQIIQDKKAAMLEKQKFDEYMNSAEASNDTQLNEFNNRKILVDKIRNDKSLPWNQEDYSVFKKAGWKALDLIFRIANDVPEGYYSETQRLFDFFNDPNKYFKYVTP